MTQNKSVANLLTHISALGSKEITLLIPIFFYLINQKQLAVKVFLGLIIIYTIGMIIRLTYNKERPKQKPRNNLLQKIEANSFPSMHATRSTFILLILLQYFQYEIKISIFLSIIYITILYARIHKKRHDYIDLIGGIILGLVPFIFL
jgi:membrane-associated phospholipid phosphatase